MNEYLCKAHHATLCDVKQCNNFRYFKINLSHLAQNMSHVTSCSKQHQANVSAAPVIPNMSEQAVSLYNGFTMPLVGLGTWHHGDQKEMTEAIRFSVQEGFRHIDCAYVYGNEKEVGVVFSEIIGEGKEVDRSDIFIAGKLWCTEHAADRVEAACRFVWNTCNSVLKIW